MDGITDSMNMSLNKLHVIGKPGMLRFMGYRLKKWEKLSNCPRNPS